MTAAHTLTPSRSELQRYVAVLQKVPMLALASREELGLIAANLEHRTYRKGDVVYQQDDPPGGLYILVAGAIKLVLFSSTDKQVVIGWVNTDSSCYFGIKSLAGEGARTETAVALEASEVLIMTPAQLHTFFDRFPAAKDIFIAVMADRWRYTIEQLADFVFLDVAGRLAKALVNRAGRMRPSGDSTNGAFLDITQHDLASFVGATREMVNKTLHAFARQSWIELREGRVRVLREDLWDPLESTCRHASLSIL